MTTQLANRILRGVVAGVVLCLASMLAHATTNSPWFARAWQSDEDLPNNTITGLAQTSDGYLWLGTPSGLVRFDGVRFQDFSPTNFVAPPNRGTVTLLGGRNGALWLAMDRGGVVRLQAGASRAFTAGLPSAIPNGLAEDAEGSLWIAYRGGAVYRLKDGQVSACTAAAGLPEGSDLCALSTDNQGRLWFAKAGRCGIFQQGAFQTLHQFDPQPARLATARAGGVWLCAGCRLFKADDQGRFQDFGAPQTALSPVPTASVLFEDHDGAVWMGTSFSGLFRHDASGFEAIPTTHQEILSLAEDRQGNMWVGTAGGGVNRVRRRAVALEDLETGLPFAAVRSICEDRSGTIWAVTQSGVLARRSGFRWSAMPAADNWPTDATCVTADVQGRLWIGSRQGLHCWQNGQFVSCGEAEQLRGRTLHTLLISQTGELWIGQESPSCIHRLRAGRLTTFEVPQDSRVIRAMAEDAAGNIWAGTSRGILFRVTGEQLSEVRLRASKENASIRCLYATPDGALWLGYAGWGVGRLKDGHYAEIRSEDGLYDNYISHIVADYHGWLWFGADRGVFKVRLQELAAVAGGGLARLRSIHYGRGEGLPSLQGTFGDSPGALCSRDGRLWLPMRTALVVVDPAKLRENPEPPPVVLERVAVDERTVAWYGGVLPPGSQGGSVLDLGAGLATAATNLPVNASTPSLRLPPAHRHLEFTFAAPAFAAPENVQFRYRLEGFDENWVEAGAQRSASYSRLSPGAYVFQVTACNSDGLWNPTGTQLNLLVTPFFWQTWWFGAAALTGFTLVIVGLVRYVSFRRLHRQLRLLEAQAALHKERARIAKDIHDDLGANLTQIALLGELAQQDRAEPDKAVARIVAISGTARQAIKSLDEIVWAVNPRNDTLAHLIDYAGQFALDYLRVAGIRCRLDLPEQTPARDLSTDVRHNLFLVIKEALNNIVKHARATEVWLRAKVTDQRLELSIEDNGCGFAQTPDDALADGLRNMRQRLVDIGGECLIASRPGGGTRVTVHVPWAHGTHG